MQGLLASRDERPALREDEKEMKERKKNGNGSDGTSPEWYRPITCDLWMLYIKQVIF
jgi:hypothetical protein